MAPTRERSRAGRVVSAVPLLGDAGGDARKSPQEGSEAGYASGHAADSDRYRAWTGRVTAGASRCVGVLCRALPPDGSPADVQIGELDVTAASGARAVAAAQERKIVSHGCPAYRFAQSFSLSRAEVIPCSDAPYTCDGFDPADWEPGRVPDFSVFREWERRVAS